MKFGITLANRGILLGLTKATPKDYRVIEVLSGKSYNSIPGGMRHP